MARRRQSKQLLLRRERDGRALYLAPSSERHVALGWRFNSLLLLVVPGARGLFGRDAAQSPGLLDNNRRIAFPIWAWAAACRTLPPLGWILRARRPWIFIRIQHSRFSADLEPMPQHNPACGDCNGDRLDDRCAPWHSRGCSRRMAGPP